MELGRPGAFDAVVTESIRALSVGRAEPDWLLRRRLRALEIAARKPMPSWGSELAPIDLVGLAAVDDRGSVVPAVDRGDEVPGAGPGTPTADPADRGVVCCEIGAASREHPELLAEYLGSVIPAGDNVFAALNTAAFSHGSFVYVPPGVRVEVPLQTYRPGGDTTPDRFGRTLVVVDEGASARCVTGCTAPVYRSDPLYCSVVEVVVRAGARCRFTAVRNWSANTGDVATRRARVEARASMEWVDLDIGARVTVDRPATWLVGESAAAGTYRLGLVGDGQSRHIGPTTRHLAAGTRSTTVTRSVSRGCGRVSCHGPAAAGVGAGDRASGSSTEVLVVDDGGRSRLDVDQLFHLMSRGLTEAEATATIVRGFLEPVARELPMELAIELDRSIELWLDGAS